MRVLEGWLGCILFGRLESTIDFLWCAFQL